ncbi:gephyrin-like molybdotransferase Glp [uncultured Thermanaerothrix sp.]|uniref:molybdenum cofactor synthesis domain-containing protein n=1 Tax=uncultured Thermanaerothrix sp. TaxID=1195149 RepID=UPI0026058F13|nr:gephyrin-like molybdotransferase Glp [uncultured Thermanaerothrix sp.]
MGEFLALLSPQAALERWLNALPDLEPETEELLTLEALGRVTMEPIRAPEPMPFFPRSTVDGYAVRAADTFGASDSLPAYLAVVGEVEMGQAPEFALQPGQAALIYTGGMLPEGADAVVMLEHTQMTMPGEIEVLRSVGVGENVLKIGEDVQVGEEVIPAGVRLRPPEIGGLMGLGITKLRVAKKPRVGILSSGDEVIPPEQPLRPAQVRDINSYSLSALVELEGGLPQRYGIVPDREEVLREVLRRALDENDLVIISAGSSISTRDLTARIIDEMGLPGVLVHGINIRPGKPTILAVCNGKPLLGLSGNPVSALVVAQFFLPPVLGRLLGLRVKRPRARLPARLTLNLPSQAGREDYVPVRLIESAEGLLAEPIFYKSNLIFSLVRADGLLRIPADATGLASGAEVEVWLL